MSRTLGRPSTDAVMTLHVTQCTYVYHVYLPTAGADGPTVQLGHAAASLSVPGSYPTFTTVASYMSQVGESRLDRSGSSLVASPPLSYDEQDAGVTQKQETHRTCGAHSQ